MWAEFKTYYLTRINNFTRTSLRSPHHTNISPTSWDDWVPEDRLRKFNDENKALAADLLKDLRESQRQERAAKSKPTISLKKDKRVTSELGSVRGSEDRSSVGAQAAPRGVKRARDWETIEKVILMHYTVYCEDMGFKTHTNNLSRKKHSSTVLPSGFHYQTTSKAYSLTTGRTLRNPFN